MRHIHATVRHPARRLRAVSSGKTLPPRPHPDGQPEPVREATIDLTERRRSRTDRAWGCHTAQVLKT
jgi:hypothetical protein